MQGHSFVACSGSRIVHFLLHNGLLMTRQNVLLCLVSFFVAFATPAWAGNAFLITGDSTGTVPFINAGRSNGTTDATALGFQVNGAEVMRVTANEKVGIGTTGPYYNLHLNGGQLGVTTTDFNNTTRTGSSIFLGLGATTGSTYGVLEATLAGGNNAGGSLVLNPYGGNVGIGTTTPIWQLTAESSSYVSGSHVIVGTRSADGAAGTVLGYEADGTTATAGFFRSAGGKPLYLGTSNVSKAVTILDTSGNVGIGTTSPRAALDVRGGGLFGSNSFSKAVGGTTGGNISLDNGTTDVPGIHFYLGNNVNFGIDATGTALRFVYNLDETGGLTGMTMGASGDVWIAGTLTQNSDARLKTDVHTIPDSLEKISQLRGVTFRWKDKSMDHAEQMGVIAQDVQAVFPQLVRTDTDGQLSVNYSGVVAPLIEAVKDLKAENDALRARLDALESRLK